MLIGSDIWRSQFELQLNYLILKLWLVTEGDLIVTMCVACRQNLCVDGCLWPVFLNYHYYCFEGQTKLIVLILVCLNC